MKLDANKYNAKEMIQIFLSEKGQEGVVKNTLRTFKTALMALHRGVDGIPTEQDLKRCLSPKISNAYHNKRLSTYRQFYNMLVAFGHVRNNPTENMHYRKTTVNIKNYNECNIKKFLSEIDITTFAGLRDYIMCLLIIDTGIRPSEVVQIRKEDVDYTNRQIHLRSDITKTRTPRTVPVSEYVIQKILKLHTYELNEWDNPYIFCTSEGRPITTMAFRYNLHKIALKTGIYLTPYDFRHIFATTYIRNGGDAFTLQRIMGHTKPNMTMVYVNLNADDLSIAHKKINVLGNFVTKRVSKI